MLCVVSYVLRLRNTNPPRPNKTIVAGSGMAEFNVPGTLLVE
jgi:hypothetical protein